VTQQISMLYILSPQPYMGWDRAVRITTQYGLDGPGIKYLGGGAKFSTPVHTSPVAHPASYTMGTGSFSGVKWPGRSIDHPPTI